MEKLPVYEVTFDDSIESPLYGITAVSLVDFPAIAVDFMKFKEQERPKFYFNDDKREIIGPALIPGKPIYRVYNGQEFYIVFTQKVIEDMAWDYTKKGYLENLTIMHPDCENPFGALEDTSKFYNTHNWIETEDYHKAADYGFDLPLGTWMLGYKILDDELWNRIKNGELKGFSIECFIDLKETNILLNK